MAIKLTDRTPASKGRPANESSQQIDKPKAKAAINAIYKRAGLGAPLIIWTQSPLESYIAKAAVDVFGESGPPHSWHYFWWDRAKKGATTIRENAAQSLLDSGWRMGGIGTGYKCLDDVVVYEGADPVLWKDIPPNTTPHYERSERNATWIQVLRGAGISDGIDQGLVEFRNDFMIDLWARYKFQMSNPEYSGGSRSMHLRMNSYKRELLCQKNLIFVPLQVKNPKSEESLKMTDEFIALRESAGHIMPFSDICFASESARFLKLNSGGRLHSELGPAAVYEDGFAIHAWDGVLFPEEWTSEKPRARDAFLWRNTEQRRVACEMVGWDTIFKDLKARTINKDRDPEIGELLHVKLNYDLVDEMYLRVRCGTGRDFVLPVPPEMRTARQANAWTWGLSAEQYKPEVRT